MTTKYQTNYEGLYSTAKRIKGHKCALIEEVEPVAKFIKSGWFVPIRRGIKAYFSISEKNPMTKLHLKSTYKIKYENFRHLDGYYFMIHPFSNMRFHWEILMLLTYNIQLNVVPILIISTYEFLLVGPTQFIPLLMTLNFICFLDIILSFFCGYFEKDRQKIELNPRRVAKKYICTYFFFDVIATFQINYLAIHTNLLDAKWYYNIQWLARFARMKTFVTYTDRIALRLNLPRYILKAVAYTNIWIIIFLWIMLLIVLIRRLNEHYNSDSSLRTNTIIVLEMINNILLIRVPRFVNSQPYYETLIYLISLFVGLFLQMFITAQVTRIYTCRNFSKNKYIHLMNQIRAYTKFKQVPSQINERIKSYVCFKFQKTVFKEKMIMDTLSNSLKNEIIWHFCQNFITRVDIFKDMPPTVMMKLVMLLKQEIYLPNDIVIQTGEIGTEMFFIYVGVLAVYTPSGKEICHLTDGDHFGEIALLLNETRVASCVAIDFCELYRLTKRDFNEALEAYPAAKLRILELGQDRFKETKQLNLQEFQSHTEDDFRH